MPRRFSLSSGSQVEGLVEEADKCVNAVALSVNPSVGFLDRNQHSRTPSSSPPACSHVSPPTSRASSSEPQQQPPPISISHGPNESNPQVVQPFRRRKGQPPETPVSTVDPSSEYPPHVPLYQQQPSQETDHASSSHQPLPSSQQPGVNEGAVNGCAVHRNATSCRPATSPLNTRLPSSSRSKGNHLHDPPPSSVGRHHIGDDSPVGGTSHLTPNRFNGWSQPSEGSPMNSCGDAVYSDDPPPSFHDALLARTYVPDVGSRSEGLLASTAGNLPVRPATDR